MLFYLYLCLEIVCSYLIYFPIREKPYRLGYRYDLPLFGADSFEDLESPPSSVLAVMKNRWLSNSFKVRRGS
jgi:hypothetical protein